MKAFATRLAPHPATPQMRAETHKVLIASGIAREYLWFYPLKSRIKALIM